MWTMAFFAVLAMLHTATSLSDVVVGGIGVLLLAPLMALFIMPGAVLTALTLCLMASFLLARTWQQTRRRQRITAVALGLPIGLILAPTTLEEWGTLMAIDLAISAGLWFPGSVVAMLAARYILFDGGWKGYRR